MKGNFIVKAVVGGFFGLVLGVMSGCEVVIRMVSQHLPPAPSGEAVGWDVFIFLRSPLFWSIVLGCTMGFAFLATQLGRGAHHSNL